MTQQPPNLEPPSSSLRHLLLALAVGLCLLLPTALAHNTTGGRAGSLSNPNGVSGNYVGPSGPAIADPLSATYIAPVYAMACDLESDETNIDGYNNPNGWVGDGTWDDGGYGGACHTGSNTVNPWFNTFGCQPGQQAYASDAVFGVNVFLAAACDWKEDQGGSSTELALAFCLANGALAFNAGNAVVGLADVVQCGADAVACLFNPACGATGSVQICGADGVIDAANYGYGGGFLSTFSAAIFPLSPNAVVNGNPPVYSACAGRELAAVYVLSVVDMYGGTPDVYAPTTGWIDSGVCSSGCSSAPPSSLPPPQLPPAPTSPQGQPPQNPPGQAMGHR